MMKNKVEESKQKMNKIIVEETTKIKEKKPSIVLSFGELKKMNRYFNGNLINKNLQVNNEQIDSKKSKSLNEQNLGPI